MGNKEDISMMLAREAMAPYDVIKVWESWGIPYVSRLSFIDVSSAKPRRLQHRAEAVPPHPSVVKLDGQGSVLTSLALALKQRLPGAAPAPVWDKEAAREAEARRGEERAHYEEERQRREQRLAQGSGNGDLRIWDLVRAEEAGIDTGRRRIKEDGSLKIRPGKVGPPLAPRSAFASSAARMAELPPEVQQILSESPVRGEFAPSGTRLQPAQPPP
eukprot:NODE_2244_length_969_cov_329.013129.p1 GENE.NODE_2244_length_969_cov_329.013129~~NODE_2244_length_969_cov_329.013129.p1  ORF type:complete len:216 (+),score=56.23 NODE_2244_length_969_cov_329.013129:3-650(+)